MSSQKIHHPMGLAICFWFASSCAHHSAVTPISRSLSQHSTSDEQREPASVPIALHDLVFDWPVDSARFTRGFMPNQRRPHMGIDLAGPKNTPILASRGGTVIYRGRDFRGFGRMILIESGDGWATLYAHMEKFYVEEGQKIAMGDLIGAMGRTGRASGNHLHFEVRHDRSPVDPLPLLPGGDQVASRHH